MATTRQFKESHDKHVTMGGNNTASGLGQEGMWSFPWPVFVALVSVVPSDDALNVGEMQRRRSCATADEPTELETSPDELPYGIDVRCSCPLTGVQRDDTTPGEWHSIVSFWVLLEGRLRGNRAYSRRRPSASMSLFC